MSGTSSAFFQKQEKERLAMEVGGENFDPDLAYFKNIMALGSGHSRELEIEIAKRIDEGRRMIARALRDVRVLLKKSGKKDCSMQAIFSVLKSKAWVSGTVGSEKFHILEKAFLEAKTIFHEQNDSMKLDSFVKTEERFHNGRKIFEKARNELVEKNLRFAVSVAKPYFRVRMGLSFFDVIEEANIGLIKAAERYHHAMGFCFTTYAHWWIRHERSEMKIGGRDGARWKSGFGGGICCRGWTQVDAGGWKKRKIK